MRLTVLSLLLLSAVGFIKADDFFTSLEVELNQAMEDAGDINFESSDELTSTLSPKQLPAPAPESGQPVPSSCPRNGYEPCTNSKYRTADGSCNSLKFPYRGKSGTIYPRWMQTAYDGMYFFIQTPCNYSL